MNTEEITDIVENAVRKAMPKQWLSKSDLCEEFGIESTLVWKLINDPTDPLPFSTLGSKKQLFNREDVNAFLNRRKRNA